MKKAENLASFEGIDPDILGGSQRNKEIVKLFLKGMTNKEIAVQYGLSVSRIGQIVNRQARRARFYKKPLTDHEYAAIAHEILSKMKMGEFNTIHSDCKDKSKHMAAVCEARARMG